MAEEKKKWVTINIIFYIDQWSHIKLYLVNLDILLTTNLCGNIHRLNSN
jgi:hypothetical protein